MKGVVPEVSGIRYYVSESVNNLISNINTFFIGEIISSNLAKQTYGVKPVLNQKTETNTYIPKTVIVDCPVAYSVTGHHVATNPFNIGDLVYVGVSKESIDVQLSNITKNLDTRGFFRVVDGVILGGVNKQETSFSHIKDGDYSLFDRTNGTFIIMRKNGLIDIYSPNEVKVVAPTINITGNVNIIGNTTISGSLQVGNGVAVTGNITASGNSISTGTSTASDHISGGKSGKSHTHGGVQTGGGSTGTPQ